MIRATKRTLILSLESYCSFLDMVPFVRYWNQRANHPLNTLASYLDTKWGIAALKVLDGYH